MGGGVGEQKTRCAGRLRFITPIGSPEATRQILIHVGLATTGSRLLPARAPQGSQTISSNDQESISIITLADAGVPAISSPSSTRSKGRRWLIIPRAFSHRRGRAATTSGISVG